MKEPLMDTFLDLYHCKKIPDKRGGSALSWEKKMTVFADVRLCRDGYRAFVLNDADVIFCQKALWKVQEQEISLYIHSAEVCADHRYMKISLRKEMPRRIV